MIVDVVKAAFFPPAGLIRQLHMEDSSTAPDPLDVLQLVDVFDLGVSNGFGDLSM